MQVIFDKLNEMLSEIATAEKKERRYLYECLKSTLDSVVLKTTEEETLMIVQQILGFKELKLNDKLPIISSFLINRSFNNIRYIYSRLEDDKKDDFINSIGNYVNIMFDNGFQLENYAQTKDPLEIEIFKKIMESKKEKGVYFYKWIAAIELINPNCECLQHVDCNIHNYLKNNELPNERLDQISYHLCSRLNESRVDSNGVIFDKCKLSKILFNRIMKDIFTHTAYYQNYHPGVVFIYNQIVSLRKKNCLSEDIFNEDYKNIERGSQKIISAQYIIDHCFRKISDLLLVNNNKEINTNSILVAMEKELLNDTLSETQLTKKLQQRI